MLNRLIAKIIGESRTVGDVHACQYVLKIAAKRNALVRALHCWISSTLVVVHAAPPPEFRAHTSAVISHTICRVVEHVRGRVENGFAVTPARHKKPAASQLKLLQFINGDIRSPAVTHYETGPPAKHSAAKPKEGGVGEIRGLGFHPKPSFLLVGA